MATTTFSHLMVSHFLPLLRCPLCPSSSTLTTPVTLFCGHTVCAKHVSVTVPVNLPFSATPSLPHPDLPARLLRLTPCPLNGCTASPSNPIPPPNIHSSSRVTIYFTDVGLQPDRDAAAFDTIPDTRTDITVNKLAIVIHRFDQQQQQQAQSTHRLPTSDSGSASDSQTDEEILDSQDPSRTQPYIASEASSSSIPRQASSDGSQQGPARKSARKRRRKQLLPPRRLDAPAQSADQFEKQLLVELTCEICFSLLYQPITSPCQHVSLSVLSRFIPHPFVRPSVQGAFTVPWTTVINARSVATTCLDFHISRTIRLTRWSSLSVRPFTLSLSSRRQLCLQPQSSRPFQKPTLNAGA